MVGSKHSVRPKLQLDYIKGVIIEQVKDAKLLGITLDAQLSCHIYKVAMKNGEGV